MTRSTASLIFIFVFSIAGASHAERKDSTITQVRDTTAYQYWVTLGFGACTLKDELPLAVGAGFTLKSDFHHLTVRVCSGAGNQTPPEKIFDVGLLYGVGLQQQELLYSNLSVGLAYASVTERVFDHNEKGWQDIYLAVEHSAFSIGWQFQIFKKYVAASTGGFGLTVYGDINKYHSFAAILFTLVFGSFDGSKVVL